MSSSTVSSGRAAVLAGLGSWLPPRVLSNDELCARLATSEEWIRSRTGIVQRHVIDPGMSTGTLAAEAGARALKSAGLDGADQCVDVVMVATTTPDRQCPATAPEVASRLGLAGTAAFDISSGCSGFAYALAIGAGLICSASADRVLVIGADTLSTITNPGDRGTAILFGDGAGAALLRAGAPAEPGGLGPFDLGSDGDLADLIEVAAGGSRQRGAGRPAADAEYFLTMQGKEVFRQAVARMAQSSRRALAAAGWSTSDVDQFACHQANSRILVALADQLGLSASRVLANIDRVGNTAAASIPLLLADAASSGQLRPGDRVLITSFGAGLAWGSTTLSWPEITAS